MKIRILLLDSHEIFLYGFKALLEEMDGVEAVHAKKSAVDLNETLQEVKPDIIFLDFSLPVVSGLEAAQIISTQSPDSKIIFLTQLHESRHVAAAFNSGAAGYIEKTCSLSEVKDAIESVSCNSAYMSPSIPGSLVDILKDSNSGNTFPLAQLTPREQGVLKLIADGYSTKGVAYELNLSQKTIFTHRDRIMKKLRIRSVAGLVKYAIREGLSNLSEAA